MTVVGFQSTRTDTSRSEQSGGNEGWRRGPLRALSRGYAGQASGGLHHYIISRAEEIQLRNSRGYRATPRSMQKGKHLGAVGVRIVAEAQPCSWRRVRGIN